MRKMLLSVVDAMDSPHGGRILRLHQVSGDPLTVQALRGARLCARSPEGHERTFRIDHFALFGGAPSNARLARSGRVDVAIIEDPAAPGTPEIGLRWQVEPA